jgi:hypothetical protein
MRRILSVPALFVLTMSAFLLGRMSISMQSASCNFNRVGEAAHSRQEASHVTHHAAIVFNPECKFEIKNKGANLFSEPSSKVGLHYFLNVSSHVPRYLVLSHDIFSPALCRNPLIK